MADLRQAAQQMLDAIDSEHPDIQLRAAAALRAALAQPDRAQRMRDAGYTRRPTLREMGEHEKPEALRLADFLEDQYDPSHNLEEAAAELRRLHSANLKLAGAIDMIRETLNGGSVDDLLYIINTALEEHRETL